MSKPKQHPRNRNKISVNPTEPLQRYFDCLSSFAVFSFDSLDDSYGIDLELVKNLLEQGCLSGRNNSSSSGKHFSNIAITPHGAVVLSEWAALLRDSSFEGKFMSVLGKIVWLFAGMVITLSGALLLKIIE